MTTAWTFAWLGRWHAHFAREDAASRCFARALDTAERCIGREECEGHGEFALLLELVAQRAVDDLFLRPSASAIAVFGRGKEDVGFLTWHGDSGRVGNVAAPAEEDNAGGENAAENGSAASGAQEEEEEDDFGDGADTLVGLGLVDVVDDDEGEHAPETNETSSEEDGTSAAATTPREGDGEQKQAEPPFALSANDRWVRDAETKLTRAECILRGAFPGRFRYHPLYGRVCRQLGVLLLAAHDDLPSHQRATHFLSEAMRIHGTDGKAPLIVQRGGIIPNPDNLAKGEHVAPEAAFFTSGVPSIGRAHPEAAATLVAWARLLATNGRLEPAERAYREALDSFERYHGPDHVEVVGVVHRLALLLYRDDRTDEARPLFERALRTYVGPEVGFAHDHPKAVLAREGLAMCLYKAQRLALAAEVMETLDYGRLLNEEWDAAAGLSDEEIFTSDEEEDEEDEFGGGGALLGGGGSPVGLMHTA